jgi:hypothetical protein
MSAIFSLEALRARYGDSLLLHFGEEDDPKLLLIDGGPPGVYKETLAPRIEELVQARGGELPIEIAMVSHVDQDHVRGLLDFSEELLDDEDMSDQIQVKGLWHNSFEDLLGPAGSVSELEAAEAALPAEAEAVVAGAQEGDDLRENAEKLNWELNAGFDEFVMAPKKGGAVIEFGPLRLTVVGPRKEEIEALRVEWKAQLEELKKKKDKKAKVSSDDIDKTPTNLSSIVCLAECGKKRMLLTGDARGDKILDGLEAAGILEKGGKLDLDLIKVPHHGSSRNLSEEFFDRLRTPKFVISADGEHDNPDIASLEMLSRARRDDEFTIHMTYGKLKHVDAKVHKFFADEKADGRNYKVEFRPAEALSLRVDLLKQPPA